MTNGLTRLPAVTIQRVTAALVVLIVGFWFVVGFSELGIFTLYLTFIAVTILVVRSVPVQPGLWLGRQPVRSGLVTVIAIGCLLLIAIPAGPNNAGAELFLLIVLGLGSTCTERLDTNGTMHYTVRAKVLSGLGAAVTRDVMIELDINKDGRVLTFG